MTGSPLNIFIILRISKKLVKGPNFPKRLLRRL